MCDAVQVKNCPQIYGTYKGTHNSGSIFVLDDGIHVAIKGQPDGVGSFIDAVCTIRIKFPTSGVFTAKWDELRKQYLWHNGNLWTKQAVRSFETKH